MEKLKFIGPYNFNSDVELADIPQVSGVYLWCVKGGDDVFRVYYVGEAQDIKDRVNTHRSNLLKGLYAGHCSESLKSNKKY